MFDWQLKSPLLKSVQSVVRECNKSLQTSFFSFLMYIYLQKSCLHKVVSQHCNFISCRLLKSLCGKLFSLSDNWKF